jgi:uncharacterized protein
MRSVATITSISIYPVKSMRGVERSSVRVTRRGCEGDRRFLVQAADGTFVTGREEPRLVLVTAQLVEGGVELSAPGVPSVIARPTSIVRNALVWKTSCEALDAGNEAAEWISRWVGRSLRLVYQPAQSVRAINPDYARAGDQLSFADAYPLLLTNLASLAELNARIALNNPGQEVPMTRFRPNIVVDAAAFDEDDWRVVRIGEVHFRAPKLCDRCVFTTIDPETASAGKEPLRTLATFRRWDGQVWFGTNLIPENEGTIQLGDRVEVLERAPRR